MLAGICAVWASGSRKAQSIGLYGGACQMVDRDRLTRIAGASMGLVADFVAVIGITMYLHLDNVYAIKSSR